MRTPSVAIFLISITSMTASCRGCACKRTDEPAASAYAPQKAEEDDEDEAKEEAERAELMQPQFWRVKVVIEGQGFVGSFDKTLMCGDDGAHKGSECGPKQWTAPLAGYKQAPSLLNAVPAPGWQLARWDGEIHRADGRVVKRKKTSIKDFYVNYFRRGFDPNDIEIVTAVFKPVPPGAASASAPSNAKSAHQAP